MTFANGEMVWYRNEWRNEVKWLKSKVIKIISKYRYQIELLSRGSQRDCHGDLLRKFNEVESRGVRGDMNRG